MTTFYLMTVSNEKQIVMMRNGIVSFVPENEANTDYQAYQEWLAEGNTPEPWPPAES